MSFLIYLSFWTFYIVLVELTVWLLAVTVGECLADPPELWYRLGR